jgi:hypothetical protein
MSVLNVTVLGKGQAHGTILVVKFLELNEKSKHSVSISHDVRRRAFERRTAGAVPPPSQVCADYNCRAEVLCSCTKTRRRVSCGWSAETCGERSTSMNDFF